jgi:hypothetical protein
MLRALQPHQGAQERPGLEPKWLRTKGGLKSHKKKPKNPPGHPRRSPGERGRTGRPRRGQETQGKPRRGPGAIRGPGQRGKDKRRQEQTRPAAGRDNKQTKGLPEPLSPEPHWPTPNLLRAFRYGSTLVYI